MSIQPSFDDLGERQCRRCNVIRPLQDFSASLRSNGNVKFGSYCPPCRKAYQREWYQAHREKALAAAANRRAGQRENRSPIPHRWSDCPSERRSASALTRTLASKGTRVWASPSRTSRVSAFASESR